MNFQALTEETCYSPVTLAQAVLYGTGSYRVKQQIKRLGYEVRDAERKMLVQVATGKKQAYHDFFNSKSETTQIDELIDAQVPSAEEGTPVSVGA